MQGSRRGHRRDIAKRLIDYGFHAPTVSWPVPGTMMIEPTESEDRSELDRFCDAMIAIKAEVDAVAAKTLSVDLFKNAPHPAVEACSENWPHDYSREKTLSDVGTSGRQILAGRRAH